MSNPTTAKLPNPLASLRCVAETLSCVGLASKILDDKNFPIWSGSHHKRAHHYGDGGLLQHTFEVVALALNTAQLYSDIHKIDYKQLFLSALYHDYGKLWDYDRNEDGEWTPCMHRRKIHHISRSNVEWVKWATELRADETLIDSVSHNILSHHGSRECGSPIMPLTREAWILHLADSMSARIDDCDRLDLVTINKNA
jgi:23S rRNA maturation-related 3'-5' exoribonuclease YhaM